jgi:hypothetical protein
VKMTYRVNRQVTVSCEFDGLRGRYGPIMRSSGGRGYVSFVTLRDAERALDALAREFGWTEVEHE